MRSIIALDADGVILNFHDKFALAASEILNRPIHELNSSYSLERRFGITSDELTRVWDHFAQSQYWRTIEPLDGAIAAIQDLRKSGHDEIHVVTAIPEKHRLDRHHNFKRIGFEPHAIHCVEHTTRYAKVPPIEAIRPLVFVDDRIEHLHSNQSVPILVHIDYGDEQFPDPHARVDATVRSLRQWTDDFLNNHDHWMHQARQRERGLILPSDPALSARSRISL